MKKIVLTASLIAATSMFGGASTMARTIAPSDASMSSSNPMDAQAKMMMSKKKMMMMKKKKMMMKKGGM